MTIHTITNNEELLAMRAELTVLENACNEAWKSYKDGPEQAMAFDVLNIQRAELNYKYSQAIRNQLKAKNAA